VSDYGTVYHNRTIKVLRMEVSVYIWPVNRTIIHSTIVIPAVLCCQVLQTVNTNLVSELHKRILIFWPAKVLSNPLQYFYSAFPSFKVYISTHCYLLSPFTKFVPDISGNKLEMHCLSFQDFKAVTVHIVVNMTTRVCVCVWNFSRYLWHNVTYQKTWIFSNTDTWTKNLACCLQL